MTNMMQHSAAAESTMIKAQMYGHAFLQHHEAEDYRLCLAYLDSSKVYTADFMMASSKADQVEAVAEAQSLAESIDELKLLLSDYREVLDREVPLVEEAFGAVRNLPGELEAQADVDGAPIAPLVRMAIDFTLYKDSHEQGDLLGKILRMAQEHGDLINGSSLQGSFQTFRDAVSRLSEIAGQSEMAGEKIESLGGKTIARFTEIGQEATRSYYHAKRNLALSSGAVMLTAIALCLVVAFTMTRSIVRNVKVSQTHIDRCATGHFNVQLEEKVLQRHDEFGDIAQSVQHMADSVHSAITQVVEGTSFVASASEGLSHLSRQISERGIQQASGIEAVGASTAEMSAAIDQNADNAQETKAIAEKVQGRVEDLRAYAQKSLDSVKTITEKIGVISEIANQTNILALNAAVEAARAGEHGRGFSVVATEIRTLAERSQLAASDIEGLSSQSLSDTESAVASLEDVLPDVLRTSCLVQEIAASSQEQRSGANQINTSVQDITEIVQQNAKASEELAKSAAKLSEQAEALREATRFFKA